MQHTQCPGLGKQHYLAKLLDGPPCQYIPQLHLALTVPGEDVPLVIQDAQCHQTCSRNGQQ